jgi:hypothetical protein
MQLRAVLLAQLEVRVKMMDLMVKKAPAKSEALLILDKVEASKLFQVDSLVVGPGEQLHFVFGSDVAVNAKGGKNKAGVGAAAAGGGASAVDVMFFFFRKDGGGPALGKGELPGAGTPAGEVVDAVRAMERLPRRERL